MDLKFTSKSRQCMYEKHDRQNWLHMGTIKEGKAIKRPSKGQKRFMGRPGEGRSDKFSRFGLR